MVKRALIRKVILYFIYTMLCVCVQVSYPENMTFNHQVVDIMFVYVCLVGYYNGIIDGVVIGSIVGVCRDVLATPIFIGTDGKAVTIYGLGLVLMMIVGFCSANFFTKHTKRKLSFALMSVLVMTIVYKMVGHMAAYGYSVFLLGNSYGLTLKQVLLDSVTTQFILNILCALPIVFVLRFIGPYKQGVNPRLLGKSEFGGDDSWLSF